MIKKEKGVLSLDFRKWGRHGLRGLSRVRVERRGRIFEEKVET